MTTKATIDYRSADGAAETLSVWPAIPGVTDRPAIQIDPPGAANPVVVEYDPADAERIALAILAAAKVEAPKTAPRGRR